MAKGCPIPALKEAPGDGGTTGSSGPLPPETRNGVLGSLPTTGSSGPLPPETRNGVLGSPPTTGSSGPHPPQTRNGVLGSPPRTGSSGPLPTGAIPWLSHAGSHQGVTSSYMPGSDSHAGLGGAGGTAGKGGGGGGGGYTVSVCQADRLGSRGQNVETSISGSCWCGGHEAQRTSRQRPPTIVAGAERRQSLRRLHVAHPVLDHGVGCLAVAGMVGRRRAGGASTPALKAR